MTAKTLIRTLSPHVELHRDPKTGIAWVQDGSTGCGHSCHPNIDHSGSVTGMKSRGFWNKEDRVIKCGGYSYNISRLVIDDKLDEVAAAQCRCGGNHGDYQQC